MPYEEEPLLDAAQLGSVYRGWECPVHGVVPPDDVTVMPDGTAWHSAWGQCGSDCRPVDLLVHDPRDWAQEGAAKMQLLAAEVVRLRRVLAQIAGAKKESASQLRMRAKKALGGLSGQKGEPV